MSILFCWGSAQLISYICLQKAGRHARTSCGRVEYFWHHKDLFVRLPQVVQRCTSRRAGVTPTAARASSFREPPSWCTTTRARRLLFTWPVRARVRGRMGLDRNMNRFLEWFCPASLDSAATDSKYQFDSFRYNQAELRKVMMLLFNSSERTCRVSEDIGTERGRQTGSGFLGRVGKVELAIFLLNLRPGLVVASAQCGDSTCSCPRRTPLMTTVEHGHLDTLIVLLDLGANIHAQDVYRRTALHRAVSPKPQLSAVRATNLRSSPDMCDVQESRAYFCLCDLSLLLSIRRRKATTSAWRRSSTTALTDPSATCAAAPPCT